MDSKAGRRKFIQSCLIGASSVKMGMISPWALGHVTSHATNSSQPGSSQKPYLRIGMSVSRMLGASFHRSCELSAYLLRFSEIISRKTAGELIVAASWRDRSVRPDILLTSPVAFWKVFPEVELLAASSPLLTSGQKLDWLNRDDVNTLGARLYERINLKQIRFSTGAVHQGHVSQKALTEFSDLSLMRLGRVDPKAPTKDPIRMMDQFKSRHIDMTSPVAHSVHKYLGSHRYAAVYYKDSLATTVFPYNLTLDLSLWKSLPSEFQRSIMEAAREAGALHASDHQKNEERALSEIQADMPGIVSSLSEAIRHQVWDNHLLSKRTLVKDQLGSDLYALVKSQVDVMRV